MRLYNVGDRQKTYHKDYLMANSGKEANGIMLIVRQNTEAKFMTLYQ